MRECTQERVFLVSGSVFTAEVIRKFETKTWGCCLRINLSLVKKGSSKFKVCWKALLQYVKLLEYFKETDFLVPLGPLHCLIKLHCFIVDTQWSRGVQIIAGVCN